MLGDDELLLVEPDAGPPPEPARPQIVTVRWTLGTAAILVVMVLVTTAVAGAVALAVRGMHLGAVAQGVAIGGALISAYLVQLALVAWAARRSGSTLAPAVGLVRVVDGGRYFLAAIGVALLARLAAGWYAVILQALHVKLPGENVDVTRLLPSGAVGTVLTFVLLVMIAPLAEEVVFRGVVLDSLRDRWGDGAAIVGSSVLFALVHANPFVVLPIFGLALGLGYLFVRSRSLWVSITCHSAFNALGFIALLLVKGNWMAAR